MNHPHLMRIVNVATSLGRADRSAWRTCFVLHASTASTIRGMISNCGSLVEAEQRFGGSLEHSCVAWNAMLSAYVDQGEGVKALLLYRQMREEGVNATDHTLMFALQACGSILEQLETTDKESQHVKETMIKIGKSLHADARRRGFEFNLYIASTLMSLYGKCGSIFEAMNVFIGLPQRNVVVWCAMITAFVKQEEGLSALQLYRQMQEEGISPNQPTFVVALKACVLLAKNEVIGVEEQAAKMATLEIGQALHLEAVKKGFTSNNFIGCILVSMYGKWGRISEAERIFEGLLERNVVCWCAMLSAYVEQDNGEKALLLYRQMQEEGVILNRKTMAITFQACSSFAGNDNGFGMEEQQCRVMSLEIVIALHADARKRGFTLDGILGCILVITYAKCGSIVEAEQVFSRFLDHGTLSWGVMLSAHVEHDEGEKALQMYAQMQVEGCSPDTQMLVIALHACCSHLGKNLGKDTCGMEEGRPSLSIFLRIGKALHVDAQRMSATSDSFVCNSLVTMYSRCGCISEAEEIFIGLLERDSVSWNAMLSAYVETGDGRKGLWLYRQMHEERLTPKREIFMLALQACSVIFEKEESIMTNERGPFIGLEIAKALHADVRKSGFMSDIFVGSNLVTAYGKCGSTAEVEHAFDGFLNRDVASWSVLLAAYVEQGQGLGALHLYKQMQEEGCSPDQMTFVIALQACVILSGKDQATSKVRGTKELSLEIAKALHFDANRKGFISNIFVATSILSTYGKCGSIKQAEVAFDSLVRRSIVSWNAMLSTYVDQGQGVKAFKLYRQMKEEGVPSNQQTYVILLQACCTLTGGEGDTAERVQATFYVMPLDIGKALHAEIRKMGFTSDVFVSNSIMYTYGKCGSIKDTETVFDQMPEHDIVSWNTMLSAYVEQGEGENVLQYFRQMHKEGVIPDDITISYALQACYDIGHLEICMQLHFDIVSAGYDYYPSVANTLIRVYGSCASMVDAKAVFDGLPDPGVVSWNACLAGYAQEGDTDTSFKLFEEMKIAGISPDGVTLLSLLSSCNHDSLVTKGVEYFNSMMSDFGLAPNLKHYAIMLDLLGRVGDFKMVENTLSGMPMQADYALWLSLLGVCRTHGNMKLAQEAFYLAVHSKPEESAPYVLMSNVLSESALQEVAGVVESLRQTMCL